MFGDDLDQLLKSGSEIAAVLTGIEGAEGVKVEQVSGLPILSINADRSAMYRYGLNVADVQDVVAAATGGEAGLIFEGDQRFSIVVRVAERVRRFARVGTFAHTAARRRLRATAGSG